MTAVAGIDVDTNAIHIVVLEDDSNDARYLRKRLDIGPGGHIARARRMRTVMPSLSAWEAAGVRLIAIEDPMGHVKGAVPQAIARGALLACLPRDAQVPVLMIPPHEWKLWSLAAGDRTLRKGNADKDQIATWVKCRWLNRTPDLGQDALDAYAIAWAARELENTKTAADRRAYAA